LKAEILEDPLGMVAQSLFYEDNTTFRILYVRYILPRNVHITDFTQALQTVTSTAACAVQRTSHIRAAYV
jgi:hypothetical protein